MRPLLAFVAVATIEPGLSETTLDRLRAAINDLSIETVRHSFNHVGYARSEGVE